jgi:hypothetical protein
MGTITEALEDKMKRFKMKRYKLTNQVAEVDPQGAWCLWEDVKDRVCDLLDYIEKHGPVPIGKIEEMFGKEIWDD